MNDTVHVLSIGPKAHSDPTCDRYLEEQGYVLAVAEGYKDLLETAMDRRYDVAVLQEALSQNELLEVTHFIRRRWPTAGIVIVRQEEWWLVDALYDERVMPGAAAELLVSAIERLVA
jgi:DNA-binding NtrC family response regulator